jgi:hypothetical protein
MKTTLVLLCGFGIVASSAAASEQIPAMTMNNLQAAFNGESNAHARYLAFAKKAGDQGYVAPRVCSGPRQEPRRSMQRIMQP